MAATVSSQAAAVRPATTTDAPTAARPSLRVRPMPRPAAGDDGDPAVEPEPPQGIERRAHDGSRGLPAVMPPSTTKSAPVQNDASSEARNTQTVATSSADAMRPKGYRP